MSHVLDRPLAGVAAALRRGEISAVEVLEEALRRHDTREPRLNAYRVVDREGATRAARRADRRLAAETDPPPFCGIPVSVKDLYGLEGHATFAGTSHALPDDWRREGWLVSRLREQGAVFVGKTHTVELAFGGVGLNPHWGTPRNPRDDDTHRIPGGSSSGAGVSLVEGSALVALGTDTGGSIRIPASMTGTVGHKTTVGRWPTDGVVPLSPTLDTVGGLTRSVEDAAWLFGAVDPERNDPPPTPAEEEPAGRPPRIAVPRCDIWDDCQADIAGVLDGALSELAAAGWRPVETDGALLDRAGEFYLGSGLVAAECAAFLDRELPEWWSRLDPIVGERIEGAPPLESDRYGAAEAEQRRLASRAPGLFDEAAVLAVPGHTLTPPPVAELDEMDAYLEVNAATLRPTCPVSALGLCAVTFPVGTDDAGMPVGLQLVAPGGEDERLLALARSAEAILDAG